MSKTYIYQLTVDGKVGTIDVTTATTATNDSGNGEGYDVTAISGTFDGKTISGEFGPGGTNGNDENIGPWDNTIFVDSGQGAGGSFDGVDSNGLAFQTTDGQYYALYTEGNEFFTETLTNPGDPVTLDSFSPPCFCRGARLLSERGLVAVEHLEVGDRLVTAVGGLRPIRWIGHRALDCRRHRDPRAVWPVRVEAGAFGERQPTSDLWLSPAHAVAVDGALVPIRFLINGRSIAQVETDRVEYWHVELDEHDILIAEGLPAQSYLDNGNRGAFVNGGAFIEAHPDFKPKYWRETCLPLIVEQSESTPAKARVLARLFEQGFELTREADAHVVADGRRIEPTRLSETLLSFAPPEGCKSVVLKSNTFIPAHALAESGDERELGLCVSRLHFDSKEVALDDEALSALGWHVPEREKGRFLRRWTRGETKLPAGARLIRVELAGQGLREADAHVMADGRRIEPTRLSETQLSFAPPAGCKSVVLKSQTFIPAHASAESGDERELGLCVSRLHVDSKEVALDDDALSALGWHVPEREKGRFLRRWTRGETKLPAGARLIRVELAGHGLYWRESRADPTARVARA